MSKTQLPAWVIDGHRYSSRAVRIIDSITRSLEFGRHRGSTVVEIAHSIVHILDDCGMLMDDSFGWFSDNQRVIDLTAKIRDYVYTNSGKILNGEYRGVARELLEKLATGEFGVTMSVQKLPADEPLYP